MNRQLLIYFSLFIGLIAFTIAYCAVTHFHLPLPRYYPMLNRWSIDKDANLPSIGWYSQTIMSLLIGCGFGGIAYLVGRLLHRSISKYLPIHILGWIAVAAAILMMLYIFQHEWRDWMVGQ